LDGNGADKVRVHEGRWQDGVRLGLLLIMKITEGYWLMLTMIPSFPIKCCVSQHNLKSCRLECMTWDDLRLECHTLLCQVTDLSQI